METTSPKRQIIRKNIDGEPHFNTKLIKHIKKKNSEAFQNYLKTMEAPQDARDSKGASLLHIAAEYGSEDIARHLLIELAFNVDLQDELGQTPLMIALKNKQIATVKVLLESNAKYDICALQMVVAMDPLISRFYTYSMPWTDTYWEVVGLMLDRLDDGYTSDSERIANTLLEINCSLSHVVFMKNSKVMRIMIEKGCAVNAQDSFQGKTALHWAVKYSKLDKVEVLLDCGAVVEALDYYECSPLMYVYFRVPPRVPPHEVELVKILLEHKVNVAIDPRDGLFKEMRDIFRYGSKGAIRVALDKDPTIFLRSFNGTLLDVVAQNTNPGVEESIKGQQMNVNRRDMHGSTAIFYAIQYENDKVAEYFLSAGASLDIANYDGETPMHLPFIISNDAEIPFTIEGRLRCLKVMLEYGGDAELVFQDGRTILEVVLQNQKFASLAEPVLAQLAIKESLGVPMLQIICQQIRSHDQFKSYFNSRINELEKKKTIWLSQSINLFEFLTTSDKIVSHYARNRILVSKLSEWIGQLTFDPYYMGILHKRFSKVSRIAELREKAAAIVCENIGKYYGCNPIVTYKIVDFLIDEDVKYLVSCSECSS